MAIGSLWWKFATGAVTTGAAAAVDAAAEEAAAETGASGVPLPASAGCGALLPAEFAAFAVPARDEDEAEAVEVEGEAEAETGASGVPLPASAGSGALLPAEFAAFAVPARDEDEAEPVEAEGEAEAETEVNVSLASRFVTAGAASGVWGWADSDSALDSVTGLTGSTRAAKVSS